MKTRFADFLAAEKRAQRGGEIWPDAIRRHQKYRMNLPYPGDLTGYSFTAQLYENPLTPINGTNFSISVLPYDPVANLSLITLQLQEGNLDDRLPADVSGNYVSEVLFLMFATDANNVTLPSLSLAIAVTEGAPSS